MVVRREWVRDALLRAAGLALLACCWGLIGWLFRHARHADPTFVDGMAAAAGYVCFCVGAILSVLGEHVFDPVEISERWATRRPD